MTDKLRFNPLAFLDSTTGQTRTLWVSLTVAFFSAFGAVFSTGLLHRLSSVILNLAFLLTLLVVVRYPVRERIQMDDIGTHKTPRDTLLGILRGVLTILYNVGIVMVVLGFLVTFDSVELTIPQPLLSLFPLLLAVYMVILGMVAQMHVQDGGRFATTWYSRASIVGTWIMGALVFVMGVVMLAIPEFSVGPWVFGDTQLLVGVLMVGLSVATSLFFLAGIPTAYDLIIGAIQKDGSERAQTPAFVYGALVALGAVLIVGFAVTQLGIIGFVGEALSSEQGAYILILLPVALASFSLYSSVNMYRRGRVGLYKKRLPTKLRNDILVFGSSSILGTAFSFATFMVLTGRWSTIGPFDVGFNTAKDLIMMTILVTVGPIGIYMTRIARRIDNIETRLPDFLNDLAETRRAGLTLTASLHTAARSDYGLLTDEVRKMSNQVAWGVAFTDALNMFASRVKSSLVARSTNLIVESSKTGGSVAAIIKAAADDAREIKSLESERRATLSTYLVVIYVTFFVFITVIAVLDNSFIPQVVEAQEKILTAEAAQNAGSLANALATKPLNQEALQFSYFNAAVVQSIGNGLVGGLLVDQRITSGFRHIAIMAFIAWIVFRWLLAF